jgi:hypothetical protein
MYFFVLCFFPQHDFMQLADITYNAMTFLKVGNEAKVINE